MTSLRLSLSAYRVPLPRTAANAQTSWSERSGLLLTLKDEQGVWGQGEAAPLPGYADDSLEHTEHALRSCRPDALADAFAMDLSQLGARFVEALPLSTPSARFALETAFFDWVARRRGEPLYRVLRAVAGIERRPLSAVPLAALIDLGSDAISSARRAVARGFSTLKVKVGRGSAEPLAEQHFAEELDALLALRRTVGPQVSLRLDANRAFLPEALGARLAALAVVAPEFVEEPAVDPGSWPLHPAVPVALDESLRSGFAWSRTQCVERRIAAAVLKPGTLGGILTTLELAARVESSGLIPIVSHAFEGPVGFAAACELALALGVTSRAAGLGPHLALQPWSDALPPSLAGAELVPHLEPGLGLRQLTGVSL